MADHLTNASFRAITFDLLVLYGSPLAAHRRQPSDPEHAGPFVVVSSEMIKDDGCLARHLIHIKSVLHQQKDVNVVGRGLGGHQRTENNESGQLSGAACQFIDMCYSLSHDLALEHALPKCSMTSARVAW